MPLNLYNVAVEQTSPTSTYSMTSTIYNNHLDARPCWYRKRLASHHILGCRPYIMRNQNSDLFEKRVPQNPVHQRFPNKMQFCGINIFLLFLTHPHGYYQLTNVPRYQPGCTHKYWGSKFLSLSAMTAPCRNWRP